MSDKMREALEKIANLPPALLPQQLVDRFIEVRVLARNALDADLAETTPSRPVTAGAEPEGTHDEGIDCALLNLCQYLGVDPHAFSWDAATETVDGDVQAVIGNILRAKFGEDWGPAVTPQDRGAA